VSGASARVPHLLDGRHAKAFAARLRPTGKISEESPGPAWPIAADSGRGSAATSSGLVWQRHGQEPK
jgi:hypothetical protein